MLPYRTGRPVLFLAVAGILLISSVTFAQNSDSLPPIEKKRPNSLKAASWSLQFHVTSNFTLNAFQGVLISSKVHFSDRKALRFGMGMGASMFDGESVNREARGDTVNQTTDREEEGDAQNFDISFLYLSYPSPSSRINLFFGTGPFFRFARNSSERKGVGSYYDTAYVTYTFVDGYEFERWAVGLSGVFGAECFATKNLSLHAEYGLFFEYSRGTNKNYYSRVYPTGPVTSEYEDVRKVFNIGQPQVKLGLSIYF